MREIAPRAERLEQRRDVVLADHHAAEHHELAARRPDPGEIGAELAAIERHRAERASADRRARQVAVVGMHRRRDEADAGAPLEIVEHASAPCARKASRCVRRRAVAEHRGRDRLVAASSVSGTPAARALPGAGNPDRAGRGRGGAADLVGLLAEQDLQAFELADQRRGHPARAGADHQEIGLNVKMSVRRGQGNPIHEMRAAS